MNNYITSEEKWKDIQNYVGYYQVSDRGRIRSVGRFVENKNNGVVRYFKGRILKHSLNRYGYPVVNLSKNNITKKFLVHRLLGKEFLPTFKEGLQVNHKDGVKTNNVLENLEMVSNIDNIRHAHKTGLVKRYGKKLNENDVLEIRKRYALDSNITHQILADEYGVSDVSISKLLSNKSWKKLPHYTEFQK